MQAFDILGDPVRRRILELLVESEHASGEVIEVISREFGITQSAVSQQLKVLRESGFATVRAEGTRRVYAVDISPDMVRHLNKRLRDANVRNVFTVLAEPDDPLLPSASVDRFVIVDTWHHVEAQAKYLDLMKKMLKPGGQVVHIDYHKRELPVGPPLDHKIAREDVVKQMEAAGFALTAEHTFLPYQYFLVFALGGARAN